MPSMLEGLASALGGDTLGQLAGALGGNNDVIGKAVGAALPALLGGLAKNTQSGDGAASLLGALDDHDGSVLDNLSGLFGSNDHSDGGKILGHIFGQRQDNVAKNVAKSSGLDLGAVMKLLPILAPVVLGWLGRRKQQENFSAADLAGMLQSERQEVDQDEKLGGFMGMLDRDGDGDVDMQDLLGGGVGGNLLGKLLGG